MPATRSVQGVFTVGARLIILIWGTAIQPLSEFHRLSGAEGGEDGEAGDCGSWEIHYELWRWVGVDGFGLKGDNVVVLDNALKNECERLGQRGL